MSPWATGLHRQLRPCLAPVSACLLALVIASACSSGREGEAAPERKAERKDSVPVTIAEASVKDAPVELHAIGNVEAYATVSVRSQVEGQVAEVHFREGQEVRRGDMLFLIDPRAFEAALRQAEANLRRDRAQAENLRHEAERIANLFGKGVISRNEHDDAQAKAHSIAATVDADQAAVESQRLQVQYCSIRSPIDGRVGQVLVHEGNVVKVNDTLLAVIHRTKPIYVSFAVPQQELPAIRRYMGDHTLRVRAAAPGTDVAEVSGTLTFIDNAVNPTSGTVLLKATFDNPDEALWPGQFVNVALVLTTEEARTVIPAQAVLTGQKGQYAFVVKQDRTVESRPIVVARTVGGEAVVRDGIRPGEEVVTDGQLRLAPGIAVVPKESNLATSAGASGASGATPAGDEH